MTASPTDVPPPTTRLPAPPTEPAPMSPAPRRRSPWAVVLVVILVTIVVVMVSVAIAALIVRNRDEQRTADAADTPGAVVTFEPVLTHEERQLLEHIPFVLHVDAARVSFREGVRCDRAEIEGSALIGFECELRGAGADRVRYTRYPTRPEMLRAYDVAVDTAGVPRYQGACKDGPPAEGNWRSSFSGAIGSVLPDGRVLCVERDGVGTIVWSHDDLRVLSETSSAGPWRGLYRFWSTVAGPLG